MALIDKASLLMVPSTYEAGTLYNVLPSGNRAPDSTDQNSGYDQTRADFTFDRGSNASATRIGSDGLIKKYRENKFIQSNNFSTAWTIDAASVTANQPDKDGGTDAWLLTDSSSLAEHLIRQTPSFGGLVTISVYAKSNTNNWLWLRGVKSASNVRAWFDLENGIKGATIGSLVDYKIEAYGTDGWYRCSMTLVHDSAFEYYISVSNADGVAGYTGDGTGSIYIQNAQLESGMVSTDYLDSGATTAKAGVLIDLPRINYDANGENGSLLLEPSRQQLLQYSEYFDGSGWNKTSGGTGSTPTTTINTNETLSPEGVYNATKIVFDSGSGTTTGDLSLIEGVVSIAAGTDASTSIWLKGENGGEQLHMRGVSNGSFSIITLTTEWQQFTTSENSSTTTDSLQFGIRQNVSGLGIINSNATIYAYGAQIELGSYATSYIPNHGTTGGVTRAADSCSVTGVSDVIGQTEGTLFLDFNEDGNTNYSIARALSISDGTYNNRVYLSRLSSGAIYVAGSVGGSSVIELQEPTPSSRTRVKAALAYSNNDYVLYVNGVQKATDTSAGVPTCSNIYLGQEIGLTTNSLKKPYNEVILFNERLTNSELATLTTL